VADQNNVIQLVMKLKDDLSAPLVGIQNKLAGFKSSLVGFAVGAIGITSVALAIRKVIAETENSQTALNDFNQAFKTLGGGLGIARESLLKFAEDSSKSTKFDSESLLRAQATLLKFSSLTGDSFTRARDITLRLAASMHRDLPEAASLVGRALERPATAIRSLREANILLSRSQQEQLALFEKTGQSAKAAALVFDIFESKLPKNAAEVVTLGDAITQLKNQFNNLFIAPGSDALTQAVKSLSVVLSNPETKATIQSLTKAIVDFLGGAVKWVAELLPKLQDLWSAFAHTSIGDFILGPGHDLSEWLAAIKKAIDDAISGWRFLLSLLPQAKTPAQAAFDTAAGVNAEIGLKIRGYQEENDRLKSELSRASASGQLGSGGASSALLDQYSKEIAANNEKIRQLAKIQKQQQEIVNTARARLSVEQAKPKTESIPIAPPERKQPLGGLDAAAIKEFTDKLKKAEEDSQTTAEAAFSAFQKRMEAIALLVKNQKVTHITPDDAAKRAAFALDTLLDTTKVKLDKEVMLYQNSYDLIKTILDNQGKTVDIGGKKIPIPVLTTEQKAGLQSAKKEIAEAFVAPVMTPYETAAKTYADAIARISASSKDSIDAANNERRAALARQKFIESALGDLQSEFDKVENAYSKHNGDIANLLKDQAIAVEDAHKLILKSYNDYILGLAAAGKAEVDQYAKINDNINALLDAGVISEQEATRRHLKSIKDSTDAINAEFDKRRAAAKTPEQKQGVDEERQATLDALRKMPVTEAQKRFQDFAKSVGDGLGRAIADGGLHGLTSLRDILQQTLRNILADILSSGIRKAIIDMFTPSGGGGSGFLGGLLRGFGALVGLPTGGGGGGGGKIPGYASGGSPAVGKPALVGENGPEIFIPRSSGTVIPNKALGSINATFNPVTNITINGNTDDRTLEALRAELDRRDSRLQRENLRLLERNGLTRLR
jgi:hypothetical protein